jgi:precorrin-6A/cobalt-precorrin-6A reductase
MSENNPLNAPLLILGGTTEGAALARRLAAEQPERRIITSFAGRVADLPSLPGEVRVGGFGGVAGLQAFLRREEIGRVIDATHPFAAAISAQARLACQRLGLPLERLERPLWSRHPGDRWHFADDIAMAARWAPRLGRRILLTVGAGASPAFLRWGGPFYLLRLLTPPPRRLPRCQVVLGRGPFTLEQERALLRRFAIDLVVTKASGGGATQAKIIAARQSSIPVLMIRRPLAPPPQEG